MKNGGSTFPGLSRFREPAQGKAESIGALSMHNAMVPGASCCR